MAKQYKVFIGVGHGGSDPGAVGVNGAKEKDYTLAISKYCASALKRCGIDYHLSRSTDVTPENTVQKCNKYNPDVAVAIHLNAFDKKARGTEVFYSLFSTKGKKLAKSVLNNIVSLGVSSRGIKTKKNGYGKDYFEFIRETNAPAILTECCFIDNESDFKFIDTAKEQKAMGEAIAKGICEYLGVKFVKEQPKSTDIYTVQVGAYSDKENALKMQKKLKKQGFEAIVVKK
jgi:N-acetylmuramoyl-L-alanine amidase